MPTSAPPEEIVALATQRALARGERDWNRADGLKARIEAAGWRVIDHGTDFRLVPASHPDIVGDGAIIYGSVASMPSRLPEPATLRASVAVMVHSAVPSPSGEPTSSATPASAAISSSSARGAQGLGPLLRALVPLLPDDVEVIVVIPQDVPVDGPASEVVRTVAPFSPGDALQAAAQVARGEAIVWLEAGWVPQGDVLGPLLEALADPTVAVAGYAGLRSSDLRRYEPAGPGDVTALRSGCLAFRRADAASRGPQDGRLHLADSVAAWWSFVLRDAGPATAPRRAVVLDLPLDRRDDGGDTDPDESTDASLARLARRDAYRIADRVAGRRWLATDEDILRGPGDGADGHDEDDGAHEDGHATQP